MEQRRHHELRQPCHRILPARWLAEHTLCPEVVNHRLKHGGLQARHLLERIERDGALGVHERGKDLVLLRDACRNQRERLRKLAG